MTACKHEGSTTDAAKTMGSPTASSVETYSLTHSLSPSLPTYPHADLCLQNYAYTRICLHNQSRSVFPWPMTASPPCAPQAGKRRRGAAAPASRRGGSEALWKTSSELRLTRLLVESARFLGQDLRFREGFLGIEGCTEAAAFPSGREAGESLA